MTNPLANLLNNIHNIQKRNETIKELVKLLNQPIIKPLHSLKIDEAIDKASLKIQKPTNYMLHHQIFYMHNIFIKNIENTNVLKQQKMNELATTYNNFVIYAAYIMLTEDQQIKIEKLLEPGVSNRLKKIIYNNINI